MYCSVASLARAAQGVPGQTVKAAVRLVQVRICYCINDRRFDVHASAKMVVPRCASVTRQLPKLDTPPWLPHEALTWRMREAQHHGRNRIGSRCFVPLLKYEEQGKRRPAPRLLLCSVPSLVAIASCARDTAAQEVTRRPRHCVM